jgi:hypothetical protein
MQFWESRSFGRYVRGVYDQGAAALIEGRRRVGDEAFDEAVRAYIATNAHRVVEPADVEEAFRNLPQVVELLRSAGGLGEPG